MANYKLPPRQKMINLLYVILIAMLAINISGEVLDGIITANKDMKHNLEGLNTTRFWRNNWRKVKIWNWPAKRPK